MKIQFYLIIFSLSVMGANLRAETQTVNGVTLSCYAITQANINGIASASLVQAKITNLSAQRMVMRFNVIVTSSKSRSFDGGRAGKPLSPQDSFTFGYTPFDKVGPEDEFPSTCQFTKVQVCPSAPPANRPKATGGSYNYPFHNGPTEGCREPIDLGAVSLPVPSVGPKETWVDASTGLTWTKKDSGSVNWDQANSYCTNLQLDGRSGWRLPTIDELQAIYDPSAKWKIKGDLTFFDWVWSSNPGTGPGEGWLFVYSAGQRYSDKRDFVGAGSRRALCVR